MLVSEGSKSDTVMARRHRSAGVDEHITYKRTMLEPRKPQSVLREVVEGSSEQGKTGVLGYIELGWRIEV